MASSLDKLQTKFRGSSGQLGQTSGEEISALSKASEIGVQPTDPASGAALGASPASAAMLGSSANQRSALRTAIQGTMSQANQERTGGPQVTDKDKQAKQAEEATRLGQFAGSLDARVQQLVGQKVKEATTDGANAQTGLKVDKETLATVPSENQGEMETLLTKLGNNTATNADILRINALMGKTQIGDQLDAATLKSKFLQGSVQIGQALASGMGDQLKVADADLSSLGVGSKSDIAALLGVDEPTLDNMSVEELLGDITDEQQKQFTTAQNIQQASTSPLLGQAERAAARAALRGASATGVLSAEDSIKDIQQQVDDANTVKFAGEDVTVEKLLSDDYLSGVVKNYLEDPTSEMSKDIAKNNPDLAEWIKVNKAGLDKLAVNVDEDTAAFAALQYEDQKLKTPPGAGTISDEGMKALIPDWGQLRSEAYVKPPLFEVLNNQGIDAGLRSTIVAGVNKLSGYDISRVQDLAGMNYANLLTLGLDNPDNMQRYIDNAQAAKSLDNAPTSSPAQFLTTLGVYDTDGFNADMIKSRRMSELGLGGSESSQLLDILDPDGDGIIQPEHLTVAKTKFADIFKSTSLGDLLRSGRSVAELPTMAQLATAMKPKSNGALPPDIQGRLIDSLNDGTFSNTEAEAIFRGANDIPMANLQALADKLNGSQLVRGSGGYQGIRSVAIDRQTQHYFNNFADTLNGADKVKNAVDLVRKGGEVDATTEQNVNEAITKLEAERPDTQFGIEAKETLLSQLRETRDRTNANRTERIYRPRMNKWDKEVAEYNKAMAAPLKDVYGRPYVQYKGKVWYFDKPIPKPIKENFGLPPGYFAPDEQQWYKR